MYRRVVVQFFSSAAAKQSYPFISRRIRHKINPRGLRYNLNFSTPTQSVGTSATAGAKQATATTPMAAAPADSRYFEADMSGEHVWGPVRQFPDANSNWHGRVCRNCAARQFYYGTNKYPGVSKPTLACCSPPPPAKRTEADTKLDVGAIPPLSMSQP
jgi:hypothetical protein